MGAVAAWGGVGRVRDLGELGAVRAREGSGRLETKAGWGPGVSEGREGRRAAGGLLRRRARGRLGRAAGGLLSLHARGRLGRAGSVSARFTFFFVLCSFLFCF